MREALRRCPLVMNSAPSRWIAPAMDCHQVPDHVELPSKRGVFAACRVAWVVGRQQTWRGTGHPPDGGPMCAAYRRLAGGCAACGCRAHQPVTAAGVRDQLCLSPDGARSRRRQHFPSHRCGILATTMSLRFRARRALSPGLLRMGPTWTIKRRVTRTTSAPMTGTVRRTQAACRHARAGSAMKVSPQCWCPARTPS